MRTRIKPGSWIGYTQPPFSGEFHIVNRRSFLLAPAFWPALSLAQASATRAAFLRLIGRPKVPLEAAETLAAETETAARFEFSFASERGQRVPGLLVKPKSAAGARLPVVVALHGTGGNKEGQLPLLERLASRGFLAVAIDGRYHGARTKAGKGSAEYVEAMLRAWRGGGGYPFLYDTVWDILRLVDWLETRADADPARIGMIGFSKGGMELYLAAAADPRIAASVPCIGVQSFRWAIDNNAWQSRVGTFQAAIDAAARDEGKAQVDAALLRKFYDRVVPGVYSDFDGPRMLPLIAPRPLLVINGDSDARTPLPGLKECLAAGEKAYAAAGAPDRFQAILQPNTGHKVNAPALDSAIAFFERELTKSLSRRA